MAHVGDPREVGARMNKSKVSVQAQTPDRASGLDEPQAQRLRRVFNIDIETCQDCCGAMKVIACIEDPVEIEQILTHFSTTKTPWAHPSPGCRPVGRRRRRACWADTQGV